jgi:hypothetical protein
VCHCVVALGCVLRCVLRYGKLLTGIQNEEG